MIRRRAVLALTADMRATDENLILLSLLDELGRAGAIDPARTRVVAGEGGDDVHLTRAADLAAVRVVGAGTDRAGRAAARVHPGARSVGERVGLGWGLVRHPARTVHGPPDVVWADGTGALPLADALPRPARRAPLVVHLPGGPMGLQRAVGDDAPARLSRARLVVVASEEMRSHLVDEVGLAPARVSVHAPWSVPGTAGGDPLAIPDDALVVAGAGPIGWRAGTDLFLDVASRLPAEIGGRPVRLVWIGIDDDLAAVDRIATDVRLRGLHERVLLVSASSRLDPVPALLVVTARESPVPLLALELAGRSVPTVGFTGCGLEEILPDGAVDDSVVARFATGPLADRIAGLLADDDARRSLGAEQGAHAIRHHAAGPRVADLWADVASQLARG